MKLLRLFLLILGICLSVVAAFADDAAKSVDIEELKKKAESGDVESWNALGNRCCYKKDYAEAVKWYRIAAEKGNVSAQRNLAEIYYLGADGIPKDLTAALKWYGRAADSGDAKSQYDLAQIYFLGIGISRDVAKALALYQKAARQGNLEAQNMLASIYSHGSFANYTESARWYTLAAGQGDSFAQYRLGEIYEDGRGVKQDYAEAAKWYRKAADQNHPMAQCNLGVLYEKGRGVPRNMEAALDLYRKAYKNGCDKKPPEDESLSAYFEKYKNSLFKYFAVIVILVFILITIKKRLSKKNNPQVNI